MTNPWEKKPSPLTQNEKYTAFGMGALGLFQNHQSGKALGNLEAAQKLQNTIQRKAAEVAMGLQKEVLAIEQAKEQERRLEIQTKEIGFQIRKKLEKVEEIDDEIVRICILKMMADAADEFELSTKNVHETREKEYLYETLKRLEGYRKQYQDLTKPGSNTQLAQIVSVDHEFAEKKTLFIETINELDEVENALREREDEIQELNEISLDKYRTKYAPPIKGNLFVKKKFIEAKGKDIQVRDAESKKLKEKLKPLVEQAESQESELTKLAEKVDEFTKLHPQLGSLEETLGELFDSL